MMEYIFNECFRHDFEKWAKTRIMFNWNKHTKKLNCGGKNFWDLPPGLQLNSLIEFLDAKNVFILIDKNVNGFIGIVHYGENDVHILKSYENRSQLLLNAIVWCNDNYKELIKQLNEK